MKRDQAMRNVGALSVEAARTLEAELEWLATCLQLRLAHYFGKPPSSPALPQSQPAPALQDKDCPYSRTVRQLELDDTERLLLILAVAHQLRPQLLDVLSTRNEVTQRAYTEFGL
ncbi:MAG TPA: hypothetical protein VFW93_12270, partial [Aquabacterium sp.]|nr:hypothetical protein [Aquabacterium sp.]